MFNPMAPPVHASMPPQGKVAVLSENEFPPLGGGKVKQRTNEVEQTQTSEPEQATQSTLVPSSALMKPGKGI